MIRSHFDVGMSIQAVLPGVFLSKKEAVPLKQPLFFEFEVEKIRLFGLSGFLGCNHVF